MTNNVSDDLAERLSDPAFLAATVNGWRKHLGLSQSEAASFLRLPLRTLQGIEQGRGFRYPSLLNMSMIYIDQGMAKTVGTHLTARKA